MLGPALADPPLPVHWHGPPACVDPSSMTSTLVELTGQPPPTDVELSLRAEPREHGWTISLHLHGSDLELQRTLEGRDCTTLTAAVALVIAVRLDPVAVTDGIWPEPTRVIPVEPAPTEPVPIEPVPVGEPAPETPPPPSSRSTVEPTAATESPTPERPRGNRLVPRVVVGTTVSGELGVLPRGAAAFELTAGAAWPRARLELGGLTSIGPDAAAQSLPSVGGRFALLTGLLRACGVVARDRLEVPLCGGLELGRLRATGTGLREPATIDAPWIAITGGARPQWVPVPRVALGAALELMAPLQRHRFAIEEAGPVHAVAPVGARLGLHLELRLP